MWPEISYWLGLAVVGVLPGLALLVVTRSRWSWSEQLAAAPGLSIGAVALAAYLAELAGLGVTPVTVLPLVALGVGGLYLLRRWRHGAGADANRPAPEPWFHWLVLALPVVAYLLLAVLRDLVILPPTVDDGVHHASWTRLIYERQTLSPAAIYAPPVSDHHPVVYPWGFHGWIALHARLTSLPVMETYWRAVLLVGAWIPAGVYVLAGRVLPRGWPCLAAALCSLLFFWVPFQPYLWGGLPLLAGATCALPLARLATDAAGTPTRLAWIAAAWVGLGLLLVHPSQAMGALLIATILAVALAVEGRLRWPMAALLVGSLVPVGLVFTFGPGLWTEIEDFVVLARTVADKKSGNATRVGWWLRDLFNGEMGTTPVLGALCALGVVAAVRLPSLRPVLWLTVGLAALLPLALGRTWVTALWYHDLERLWYLQVAALPLLAAAGLRGLATWAARLARGRLTSITQEKVIWPLALATVAGASWPYVARLPRRMAPALGAMASERGHLDDFAWIEGNVPRGALILNAPGDWGMVLPFTGRQITFANCQVRRSVREHWWAVRAVVAVADYDEAVHERIRRLGVGYVYAGSYQDFRVGTRTKGAPVLGQRALALNPGLERVYRSPTAQIFRVRERLPASFPPVAVPLGKDSPAQFEGFLPLRDEKGRTTRWTTGESTVLIPRNLLPPGDECLLVLGMKRPRDFEVDVAWDGQNMHRVAAGIFAVPVGVNVLTIRADTFVPRLTDARSDDDRSLGVSLEGLSIECRAPTPGGPAHTAAIALEGSADAWFRGFHRLERGPSGKRRWTRNRSTVFVRDRLMPAGEECLLNLALGANPGQQVEVSWNGRRLAQSSPGTYVLGRADQAHRLALGSRTRVRDSGGPPVGVGLWRLGFICSEGMDR